MKRKFDDFSLLERKFVHGLAASVARISHWNINFASTLEICRDGKNFKNYVKVAFASGDRKMNKLPTNFHFQDCGNEICMEEIFENSSFTWP